MDWEKITRFRNNSFNELPNFDLRDPNIIYTTITIDGVDPKNLSTGLFKSINDGKNWELLIENKEKFSIPRKLLIHPLDSERLMYFTGSKLIFLSIDGGKSWGKILESLIGNSNQVPEIVFDPNNIQGLYWVKETGVYHSLDNGNTWNLVDEGLKIVNSRGVKIIASTKDIFITSQSGIFLLSEKTNFSDSSDCLFDWAEINFPDVFSPSSDTSQQWGGYTYRYYNKSNTYLGFFYEQEIHILQPNQSNKIKAIGSVEDYLNLANCH